MGPVAASRRRRCRQSASQPGAPALGADPRYPDWPCVQAKVPEISAAAVWAGPPLDDADKAWESDQRVRDLVARLAPRRVPIDDAKKIIAEFVAGDAAEREDEGQASVRRLVAAAQSRTHRRHERDRAARAPPEGARREASLRYLRSCTRCRMPPIRMKPSCGSLQVGWNGARASSRTGTRRSDTSARCPRSSSNGCSRSAARCKRRWSRRRNRSSFPSARALARLLRYRDGAGSDTCSGRSASAQPSVPSGYHTTSAYPMPRIRFAAFHDIQQSRRQ